MENLIQQIKILDEVELKKINYTIIIINTPISMRFAICTNMKSL